MIRYAITPGVGDPEGVRRVLGESRAGYVQIREKQMSARELERFVRDVMTMPNPGGAQILVNTRADVALVCGAHGLHLPGASPAHWRFRELLAQGAVISVACHSVDEVRRAEAEGADLAVFSPVYAVAGKGAAQGLVRLREAVESVTIPVLALGGIDTPDKVADCMRAGAAGVAGIRLFGA